MGNQPMRINRKLRITLIAAIICCALVAIGVSIGLSIGLKEPSFIYQPVATVQPIRKSLVKFNRFAGVAADAEICSRIGTDIMAYKNGSAVDAAIAALICTGVINPQSAGIGGGSFALVYSQKDGSVSSFDFRESAPLASSRDMFVGDRYAALKGPRSIAVPGEIAGYAEMYKQYGRVKWSELFQPSIDLCLKGTNIGRPLYRSISYSLKKDKTKHGLRETFLINPKNGKEYQLNDKLYLRKLAKTFQQISKYGGRSFYEGHLAKDIAADLRDAGSIITEKDLRVYRVKRRKPLLSRLKNYNIYTLPAPSSGPVLHLILNILSGYNMSASSISSKDSTVLAFHRIIEAMKYSYAKRSYLGDEDFVEVKQLVHNMTSPTYGERLRRLITDDMTQPTFYYGAQFYSKADYGTSHVSVIDNEGNAIAMTSSINYWFGSSVVGKRTGILFNNGMDDFSTPGVTNIYGLPSSVSNFIVPGKRSQSSMTPTIVTDNNGRVKVVTGASGGTRITSATSLFLIRTLMFEQSISEATDLPRFHHQLVPKFLYVEPTFNKEIASGLRSKGHVLKEYSPTVSNVQSIVIDGKYILALSDARKDGIADGF